MTQPPPHQQPHPGYGGPYHQNQNQAQPYQQQPHVQAGQQAYQNQPYQQYQAGPPAYQQSPPYQQGQQPAQWPDGYQQQPYQAPVQQGSWQGHPAPQPQGGQAYDPSLVCRVCGGAPAVRATFRGVVGAVIMHTIWTATGPFCRDCGLEACRRQTTKTLTGGWFSVGAIICTPIFLTMNVVARRKVDALPAPQRPMMR